MRWYVSRNGETVGPVDESVIRDWGGRGLLLADHYVASEQFGVWMSVMRSPFSGYLSTRKYDDTIQLVLLGVLLPIAGFVIGFFRLIFSKNAEDRQNGAVAIVVSVVAWLFWSLMLGFFGL